MTTTIRHSRLTATSRQAGSKVVHELVRVYEDNGERVVLDTRRSVYQYAYCNIKRNRYGGRSYTWSRNKGTGSTIPIPVNEA